MRKKVDAVVVGCVVLVVEAGPVERNGCGGGGKANWRIVESKEPANL
jgi:hypothetical protein